MAFVRKRDKRVQEHKVISLCVCACVLCVCAQCVFVCVHVHSMCVCECMCVSLHIDGLSSLAIHVVNPCAEALDQSCLSDMVSLNTLMHSGTGQCQTSCR